MNASFVLRVIPVTIVTAHVGSLPVEHKNKRALPDVYSLYMMVLTLSSLTVAVLEWNEIKYRKNDVFVGIMSCTRKNSLCSGLSSLMCILSIFPLYLSYLYLSYFLFIYF